MKRVFTKLASAALAATMVLSVVPPVSGLNEAVPLAVETAAASTVNIYSCAGVQEAAYIEWAAVSGAAHYYVSYSSNGTSFTDIDDQLIRQYPDRWRADLIGLKAGSYTIKVTAKNSSGSVVAEGTKTCTVVAHDRTGFTFHPSSTRYDGGGCGAYNADGTLKSNANVLYVTEDNFDTVSLSLTTKDGKTATISGVTGICYTMGAAAAKGYSNPPLAIRFIGTIGDSHGDSTASLASPSLLETKGADGSPSVNITFEGVGQDTIFYGLGLRLNGVGNCEIRNIAFYNWHDDAIQLQGNGNSNHWIHNNDLFYGENHGGDQAKGDGATDVKDDSKYITYSYNRYWDCGKTSLCGMKSETGDNYISYHHNWFDHSDSRHPRIRTMFVHVYNNYYDGNAKYGVGAAKSSSAFVEGNYFRNCNHPMLSSLQGSDIMANEKTGEADFSAGGTFSSEAGGIIKAYNNYIEGADNNERTGGSEPVYYDASDTATNGAATQFDAYLASSRDEQVPSSVKALSGGKTFDNSNVDSYILSIPVEEPATAKNKVTTYAGRTGDHFSFTFTSADDTDYAINTSLKSKLDTYATDTSDDYVSVGGAADGSGPVETTTKVTESTTNAEASTETTTKTVEGSTETTTKTDESTETTTVDSNGAASMGTYVFGDSASGGDFNITDNGTYGNIAFSFRSIETTGAKLRSDNKSTFKLAGETEVSIVYVSGPGVTITDGTNTYTFDDTDSMFRLPAGNYTLAGASSSNSIIASMTLKATGTTSSSSTTTTTETSTESTTKETSTETTTQSSSDTGTVQVNPSATGYSFTTATAGKLTTDSTYGGASSNYNSSTNYVEIGSNGAYLYDSSATDTTNGTTGVATTLTMPLAQTYTSGKLTVSGTVTPSASSSKWAYIDIQGVNGSVVKIGTDDSKKLAISTTTNADGTNAYVSSSVLSAADTAYTYNAVLDLDAKSVTVTIGGATLTTSLVNTSVDKLVATTSASAARNLTVGNITVAYEASTTPSVVKGDSDGDGDVDKDDVTNVLAYAVGKVATVADAADVDGDGKVTVADAYKISQKVLGIISSL